MDKFVYFFFLIDETLSMLGVADFRDIFQHFFGDIDAAEDAIAEGGDVEVDDSDSADEMF